MAGLRQAYVDHLEPQPVQGDLQLGEIVAWLRERLPPEAILTNGAGNYARLAAPLLSVSPVSQANWPPHRAAWATARRRRWRPRRSHPERPVVCFAGDGCYLMHGQELATAVQYGLNVIILVINNSMYGTIRMHQERDYPERVTGTSLVNPDFVAYAQAFGAHGERIERTEDFAPAFERAVAAGRPALLELRLDPEVITPRTTLSALRAAALAKAQ